MNATQLLVHQCPGRGQNTAVSSPPVLAPVGGVVFILTHPKAALLGCRGCEWCAGECGEHVGVADVVVELAHYMR